jgi:hypothetical protein
MRPSTFSANLNIAVTQLLAAFSSGPALMSATACTPITRPHLSANRSHTGADREPSDARSGVPVGVPLAVPPERLAPKHCSGSAVAQRPSTGNVLELALANLAV